MTKIIKAGTPILALILFVFAVGYSVAANEVVVIPMGADVVPQSMAIFASGNQTKTIDPTDTTIRELSFNAPSDGVVTVNSIVNVSESTANDQVVCSITTGTVIDESHELYWESPGSAGQYTGMSSSRGFNVTQNSYTFRLVCKSVGTSGSATAYDSSLTAIFTPTI